MKVTAFAVNVRRAITMYVPPVRDAVSRVDGDEFPETKLNLTICGSSCSEQERRKAHVKASRAKEMVYKFVMRLRVSTYIQDFAFLKKINRQK